MPIVVAGRNTEGGRMDNSWQKKWDGAWDQFKGKVKQTWGQMTDDDCDVAEGKYDEMVGRIKTRTGETEEAVRERLECVLRPRKRSPFSPMC